MKNRQPKNIIYSFITAIIFIQLLGCGGGGSDAVTETPPLPVITDTTPPIVTQVAPLDYAIDVPQDTLIEVSFNELMNFSTVNNSSFIVKDNMDNTVPGVITESNTSYVFTPDSFLKYDTSYNVTITTDVTDLANNNLYNAYSWGFHTVTVPSPSTPASLDASNLTDTGVTLNGLFTNLFNDTTTAWFEYGLTDTYGTTTPSTVYSAVATVNYSADLTGLPEKTTYHYRIVTQNSDGLFYGEDKTFRTYITPVVLVDDLDGPGRPLKIHNNELYWAEVYADAVRKISVTGGSASIEATSAMEGNYVGLDMDMTHLYWTDNYKLWTKPIGTGSTSQILSQPGTFMGSPKIYLTDLYVLGNSNISKIDISTGILTTVITETNAGSYDVDENGIYWSSNGESLRKANHDGTAETIIATGLNNQRGELLLDDGTIYWSESNAIKSISTSGGQITTITENVSPNFMAKDSTNIYFTEAVGYSCYGCYYIKSLSISTGAVDILTMIRLGSYSPMTSFIVGDTHIYWLTYGNHWYPPLGRIVKCDKNY